MFKVGELVSYGANGIYEIIDVRKENVLGAVCSYYVLRAYRDKTESLIFVPQDNEALTAAMRYLMTADGAKQLLSEFKTIEPSGWTPDAKQRMENFKRATQNADHRAVVAIIKSIWEKGKEREREGKKNYQTDEALLKKAEKLLYTEISLALGIETEAIPEYFEK